MSKASLSVYKSLKVKIVKMGLWVIRQPWFINFLVNALTYAIESGGQREDDKNALLLAYLKKHKRQIITIANKELTDETSPVDQRLVDALRSIGK